MVLLVLMLPDELPDKIHIEFIRRALFRPLSRASVMVGAGFSRNADKISSAVRDFPLWWDIASRLHGELYPGKALGFGVDVLRLGQEYQETYGRTALDDLIASIIPDGKYEPGELHKLLLELPWADVFTTNYDTLLERTRAKVYQIKYDVVLTPEDIARAERPRIVKLHGSFPSQRPFLFTTEDYRRYPIDQAPFVNMVQQSIMESAFCLLGFSGDDPNFVEWIGWVRDQLGPAAPRIYLCGVFDLNASRRRYYESIRVIPVDLGPLFPESLFGTERHRAATRWLLRSLHNGKPADRTEWPKVHSMQSAVPGEPQAPLAPPPEPTTIEPPERKVEEADVDTLRKLVQSWRSQREAYPGWIICPEANRDAVWKDTLPWIEDASTDPLRDALAALKPDELAMALYEMVWRLHLCRLPVTPALAARITGLFVSSPLPPMFTGRYESMARPLEGWETVTGRFVELGFAMLNDAWQEQNEEQHKVWTERLRQVVKIKPEWQARWHFAQCWHHLLRLDEDAVGISLKEWPENPGLPFWEGKRAAVLAELGDIDAARRVGEAALERARQGVDPARLDYRALSEEGCLLELLRVLPQRRDRSQLDPEHDSTHANRLRELQKERCEPTESLKAQESKLRQEKPGTSETEKPGFDPGALVSSVHFRISDFSEWVLVQGIHDGPWPVPYASVSAESIVESVRRLWPICRRLAIAIALRAGKADELEEMLGRVEVARMDVASANSLYDWLAGALRSAIKVSATNMNAPTAEQGLHVRLIDGCSRILSRLSVRVSFDRLQDSFDLATVMYKSTIFNGRLAYHGHVNDMFKRVLAATTADRALSWLPKLLELPIPETEDFTVRPTFRWPEPMEYLLLLPRPIAPAPALDMEAVRRLIRVVQDGSPEARKRASVRLTGLVWTRALTEEQRKAYLGALWSKTDATGFPDSPGFSPWFLLDLGERRAGEAREAIAKFFLKRNIDKTYLEWLHESTAKVWDNGEQRASRIEWTSAEAEALLSKIVDWWRSKRGAEKSNPAAITIDIPGPVRQSTKKRREKWLIAVLADVLICSLAKNGSDISRRGARDLLLDIEQSGVSILRALPALLLLEPDGREEALRRIREAIHGSTWHEVLDGCGALFSWFALASAKLVEAPPHLLSEMICNVLARRQPGLRFVLETAGLFVHHVPDFINEHQACGLARALGFLIHETDATRSQESDDELPLSAEERVHLRGEASQLAAHLARYYHARSLPLPPEVEAWRSIGAVDPLPEVRLAWAGVPADGAPTPENGARPAAG